MVSAPTSDLLHPHLPPQTAPPLPSVISSSATLSIIPVDSGIGQFIERRRVTATPAAGKE